MGTTADKLNKLAETKSAIKQAIVDKGVAVADTDTFASYAEKIGNIVSFGSDNLSGTIKPTYVRVTTTEKNIDWLWQMMDVSGMTDNNYKTFCYGSIEEMDLSTWTTAKWTNLENAFNNRSAEPHPNLRKVNVANWNTASCGDFWRLFNYCPNLEWVDMTGWSMASNKAGFYDMFFSCYKLKTLIGDHTIEEVEAGEVMTCIGMKHGFGLNDTILERPSLLAVIKGLADLTESGTTQTLTLGSTLLAKLTDDDKQIATDKGWTLA